MAHKRPAISPIKFFELVFVYIILFVAIIINIASVKPALNQLLDFGSFIAAGKEAAADKNPYSIDSPLVFQVESQNTDRTLPSPNLNPPISIILFRQLADLDPSRAVFAWRITSVILFGVAIIILAGAYPRFITTPRILWALSLAGIWNTIALGQIYAPLLVLSISTWIFAERGFFKLAGIMLGCIIAVKPNFVLWLILLGATGYMTIVVSAVVSVLIISAITIPFFGFQIYPPWLTALTNYPSIGLLIAGNSSFQSLSARFSSDVPGTILSLLFACGVLYLVYHHRFSLSKTNALGIVGSLLISPFSWVGYTILTLPIFFSRQNWSWHFKLAAAILAFPYLLILYFFQKSLFNSVLFGWMYGWGLLLILSGLIFNKEDEQLHKFMETQ